MRKIRIVSVILGQMFWIQISFAQTKASEILEKCIGVHDPNNKWEKLNTNFNIEIKRNGVATRNFNVFINLTKSEFFYQVNTDTLSFTQGFKKDKFYYKFNGKKYASEESIKKYELTQDRTQYLREVYEYLLLLPMRLKNDIKFLDEAFTEENFNNKSCYKLTIRYLPIGEAETWHFYINKDTFVLEGYQFYLKDIKTDGEYIFLSNYKEIKGILMPLTKTWYWNKDKTFFREDRILNY